MDRREDGVRYVVWNGVEMIMPDCRRCVCDRLTCVGSRGVFTMIGRCRAMARIRKLDAGSVKVRNRVLEIE